MEFVYLMWWEIYKKCEEQNKQQNCKSLKINIV